MNDNGAKGRGEAFAIVQRRVWSDKAVVALSTDARLLFVWSWTNERANIAGLYLVAPGAMALALGEQTDFGFFEGKRPADDRVHLALDELAVKPLVAYDYDVGLLWVVSRAAHAARSDKAIRMIRQDYDAAPRSPLKDKFARRYGERLGLHTRSTQR